MNQIGALIFAHNNEKIDYVRMAEWNAENIQRHLGIPTTVISTQKQSGENLRHFQDVGSVSWHNQDRADAFDITPYEHTLLIDADYVVASDKLKCIMDYQGNLLCHRWAHDILDQHSFKDLNYFGSYHMPMWWATVVIFRKTKPTEMIFRGMQMIRENWNHYRDLYGNTRSLFRNDHALSIALNIENGHTLQVDAIPWSLPTLMPGHKLCEVVRDRYRIDYVTADGKQRWIEVSDDFHAMNKQQLGEVIANSS